MLSTRLTLETDGPFTSLATWFWSGYKVSGKQDLHQQVSNDLSTSSVLHPCGLFSEAFLYVHNGCWGLHSRETSACHIYMNCACIHHSSTLKSPTSTIVFSLWKCRENEEVCFVSCGHPLVTRVGLSMHEIWDSMGVDVKQWGYPPRLQSGWKIDYW